MHKWLERKTGHWCWIDTFYVVAMIVVIVAWCAFIAAVFS